MKKKVEIVTDRSAALDDEAILVCRPLTDPLIMEDNLIDICSKCFRAIQHRPNVPDVPKVCEVCAMPLIADPKVPVTITETTVREVRDYWRKRQ
jgi:hypothetical protein